MFIVLNTVRHTNKSTVTRSNPLRQENTLCSETNIFRLQSEIQPTFVFSAQLAILLYDTTNLSAK